MVPAPCWLECMVLQVCYSSTASTARCADQAPCIYNICWGTHLQQLRETKIAKHVSPSVIHNMLHVPASGVGDRVS